MTAVIDFRGQVVRVGDRIIAAFPSYGRSAYLREGLIVSEGKEIFEIEWAAAPKVTYMYKESIHRDRVMVL